MGVYFPWEELEELVGWLFVMFLAIRGMMSLSLNPKNDFFDTIDALIVDKNGMRTIAIFMVVFAYIWTIRCKV